MRKLGSLLWLFTTCNFLVLSVASSAKFTDATNDKKEMANNFIDQDCLRDKLSLILDECSSTIAETNPDAETSDDDPPSPPSSTTTATTTTQQQRHCPLTKLELDLDRNRMMHRLAAQFYEYQNFWLLFIPSIGISAVSGILATLGDSGALTNWISSDVKGLSSASVGILSIFSVFFQSISKELDYSHRAKKHKDVSVELRTLYDKIKFDQLTVQLENDKKKTTSSTYELVKMYEEKYRQTLEGCNCPFPPSIINAYELATTRLEVYVFPPFLDASDSGIDWMQIMGIVYNEVFNAFGRNFWWPLRLPHAEDIVEHAFHNLSLILTMNDDNSSTEQQQQQQREAKKDRSCTAAVGNMYRALLSKQKYHQRQTNPDETARRKSEDEYGDSSSSCTECQSDCTCTSDSGDNSESI